jgi:hypothetical protein
MIFIYFVTYRNQFSKFQKISIFMLQFKELSQPAGISVHLPLPFMNTFSTLVIVLSIPLLECFARRRRSAADVKEEEIDAVIAQWMEDEENGNTRPSAARYQASITNHFGARRRNYISISSGFNVDDADADVRRCIAEDISVAKYRRDALIRMGMLSQYFK